MMLPYWHDSHPPGCPCPACGWARVNVYAAHPPGCPCAVCGWAREQNAELDSRQDPEPVPDSRRAVCGHPAGCSCPPCVKQRALIAAGKADAAELVRQERARRKAAKIQADRDLEPEPGWVPQQIQAGSTTSGKITADIPGTAGFYDPGRREKTLVPAGPAEPEPPDPAGEVEAALRDFDAWYAAGRGCLPDPEPRPAGTCLVCHLSKAVTLSGRCFWCRLAETEREKNLERARNAAAPHRGKYVISGPVIVVIGIACWTLIVVILVVTGRLP